MDAHTGKAAPSETAPKPRRRPPAAGKGRPRGAKNKKTQAQMLAEARERTLKLELEGTLPCLGKHLGLGLLILCTPRTTFAGSWGSAARLRRRFGWCRLPGVCVHTLTLLIPASENQPLA